ncbi:MAG: hypothetical protein AAGE86_12235 [Pseudomonadota bacterium]
MYVHPAIAALRGDRASQHRAQLPLLEAVQCWQESDRPRALAGDLEDYSAGKPLADCEAFSAMFADHHGALEWLGDVCGAVINALRQEPLGDVPFRTNCSDSYSTVQLMSAGQATLSLTMHAPRNGSRAPETALLVDRESNELILAGEAQGLLHRFGSAIAGTVDTTDHLWRAGDQIALAPDDARHMVAIERPLLTLHLTRAAPLPRPTRKLRLADGQLLKSASGDKQVSRDQLALAVLGAMERREALPILQDLSQDRERGSDLRWEAVRQALAIDPARGFAVLDALAGRTDDPLGAPATSLREQLFATYPQLADTLPEAA